MKPTAGSLFMYGSRAEVDGLEWEWVEDQLTSAAGYWVVPCGSAHAHPRPVWGIWREYRLFLSIGSPRINSDVKASGHVTVHLGSINDVVIIEATTAGSVSDSDLVDAYNAKYDWNYSIEDYGPFTVVEPTKVMAWQSGGWAGREGFKATGSWTFRPPTD